MTTASQISVKNKKTNRLSNSEIAERLKIKPVVMIGMMGSGKTAIGKRVAAALGVNFVDSDAEIVEAAGRSVNDIFAEFGEEEFRNLERRVISRLLEEENGIIATGGGAYMNDETRAAINNAAVCVWLKADLDILMERVSRRSTRPLLKQPNPRQVMQDLLTAREPTYANAHVVVQSGTQSHEVVVEAVLQAISNYLTSDSN